MDIAKYKFAVELLISRVEDLIQDQDLDLHYPMEATELKKRIDVVRKFEEKGNHVD